MNTVGFVSYLKECGGTPFPANYRENDVINFVILPVFVHLGNVPGSYIVGELVGSPPFFLPS